MSNVKISITKKLSIEKATAFTQNPHHGAQASFIGYVRDHNEGKSVHGLTYDIHVPLAKVTLQEIAKKAQEKWGRALKIYIAHANGYLPIGGIAVIVMVSSAHRAESLQACAWIIEEIKFKAPVWKKEDYIDGKQEWTKGHSLRDRIT